jgi:hypothetical protein
MERCGFSRMAGGWTTLFNLVFYFLQSLPNIWCDSLLKFLLAGLWWCTIPVLGIYALIVLFRPPPTVADDERPPAQSSNGQPGTGPVIMGHRAARRPQGWTELAASAVAFGLLLLARAYEQGTEIVEEERWEVPNGGAILAGSEQEPPIPTKVKETIQRAKVDATGASCFSLGGVSSAASLRLQRLDSGFLGFVNQEAALINERTSKSGGR